MWRVELHPDSKFVVVVQQGSLFSKMANFYYLNRSPCCVKEPPPTERSWTLTSHYSGNQHRLLFLGGPTSMYYYKRQEE